MQLIVGYVPPDKEAVKYRFCKTQHSLGNPDKVILLKFHIGSVVENRNNIGKLVLKLLTDPLVGAFNHVRNPFKRFYVLFIIVNIEMICPVVIPIELIVVDLVFSIVRKIDNLSCSMAGPG